VFLAMEWAPGIRADRALDVIAGSSEVDRRLTFWRLGQLWAFDVLINNTDRFAAGNWGNVILGPGGSVVGIDQMVGVTASDMGAAFAADEADQKLQRTLNPETRRRWANEVFVSLEQKLRPTLAGLRGEFVVNFELGALAGLQAIAHMDPADLERKKAELPNFARQAADDLGVQGAVVMQGVIATARQEIGRRLGDLSEEVGLRAKPDPHLGDTKRERALILQQLERRAAALAKEWTKVDGWFMGKDHHWNNLPELGQLSDFRRAEYLRASQAAHNADTDGGT
jgi:hypothetical protein